MSTAGIIFLVALIAVIAFIIIRNLTKTNKNLTGPPFGGSSDPKEENSSIQVSPASISIPGKEVSVVFTVTADEPWDAIPGWGKCTPDKGYPGSTAVNLFCPAQSGAQWGVNIIGAVTGRRVYITIIQGNE